MFPYRRDFRGSGNIDGEYDLQNQTIFKKIILLKTSLLMTLQGLRPAALAPQSR